MTGLSILSVLKLCITLIALNFAFALPRGPAYQAKENRIETNDPLAYPPSTSNRSQQDMIQPYEKVGKPKNCFHFFVSRNMSSLLSDATKMLRQVRDRREREWILTFIYRIKSLTEHLRSHPESRNYECLMNGEEMMKRNPIFSDFSRIQQPELYFDDVPAFQNQKRSSAISIENSPEDLITSQKSDSSIISQSQEIPNIDLDNQHLHQNAVKEQSLSIVPPNGRNGNNEALPKQTQFTAESSKETKNPVSFIPTATGAAILERTQSQKNSLQPMEDIASSTPNQGIMQEQLNNSHSQEIKTQKERSTGKEDLISSVSSCESEAQCRRKLSQSSISEDRISKNNLGNSRKTDDPISQSPTQQNAEDIESDSYQQEALKEKVKNALLEDMASEVKKLRTVGGSLEDLVNLWKQSEVDIWPESTSYSYFDYEELGAAAGDPNSNDKNPSVDRTVAPSLIEIKHSKKQPDDAKVIEPYDDSDVLVQQLFDVRFNQPPSKTTKSLSDQNDDYLITSTHTPY
ncbi:hypothetical protein X975_22589, partial [Stegodyphus mimosarum]